MPNPESNTNNRTSGELGSAEKFRISTTDQQRLATLIASGQVPFPKDLAAEDATELLIAVRELRRTRLVQSIARAIAEDIRREQRR
ncbi:hypothetical protein [Thalassoroseus pseudoceratinae]|uniref:hypothetical protein n=1 Tax=Thalassoroseus pseudoceratinae TaxID=2713176 RepID=UPI00141DDD27|nr:hypothetical protein [Thalassoroseus pseudoceratinae]